MALITNWSLGTRARRKYFSVKIQMPFNFNLSQLSETFERASSELLQNGLLNEKQFFV